MPNVNPLDPNPPGGAGNSDKFPQYGLRPSDNKVITAQNTEEKGKDIQQGYVDWFLSSQAAVNAGKGMKGPLGTGGGQFSLPNPLHGIDEIGASVEAFYKVITDGKMWRSLAWIVLGAILIFTGINLWLNVPEGVASAASTAARFAVTK